MGVEGPDVEVLEFAIAREIEANQFYLLLAQRTKNGPLRQALEEFAAEELEHKAKLELEVMKLGHVVKEGDAALELEADDEVNLDEGLEMDYKDLLILAMQKEEAAFRTYVNLVGRVEDQSSRDVLLAISQEEVKHKLRFEMEYENLLKKG